MSKLKYFISGFISTSALSVCNLHSSVLTSENPQINFVENKSFSNLNINSINFLGSCQTSNKNIWSITGRDIVYSGDQGKTFIKMFINSSGIPVYNGHPTCIYQTIISKKEYVFIGTDDNLYLVANNNLVAIDQTSFTGKDILQVFASKGIVYVVAKTNTDFPEHFIYQNNMQKLDNFRPLTKDYQEKVEKVYIDSENNWWEMTINEGLWKYNENSTYIEHISEFSDDYVINDVNETPTHDFVVATWGNGLWEKLNGSPIFTRNASLPTLDLNVSFNTVFTNPQFNITYVGITDDANYTKQGLFQTSYNPKVGSIIYSQIDSIGNKEVTSIFEDSDLNLFIGCKDTATQKTYLYVSKNLYPATSSDSNKWIFIGIAIGSAVGLFILVSGIIFIRRNIKNKKKSVL